MKKIFGFITVMAFVAGFAFTSSAQTDGCYLCEGGGYVKFKGADSSAKRKKAKDDYGCKVSGTTSSCSNAKGTVE
jgi:hypothetical protein